MLKKSQQAKRKSAQSFGAGWMRTACSFLLLLMVLLSSYFACIACVHWLSSPIRYVTVKGSFLYLNRSELNQEIITHVHGSLFSLDVGKLKDTLDQLPLVKSVSIRRAWPDTVVVTVTEEQLVARWGVGSALTSDGNIIKLTDTINDTSLPLFLAQDDRSKMMLSDFYFYNHQLADIGLSIQKMTDSLEGELSLVLNNDLEVQLGANKKNSRLERFVDIYPQLLEKRKVLHYIDLRYETGVAVQ